jgi:hypothetical protein
LRISLSELSRMGICCAAAGGVSSTTSIFSVTSSSQNRLRFGVRAVTGSSQRNVPILDPQLSTHTNVFPQACSGAPQQWSATVHSRSVDCCITFHSLSFSTCSHARGPPI